MHAREALDWFSREVADKLPARRKYVIIPDNTMKNEVTNLEFIKFENWVQQKSFQRGLRRLYRKKHVPRFQSCLAHAKSWISILISDIIELVTLDLENAIVRFGDENHRGKFVQQKDGIPQGSHTSVFLATISAIFIEQKQWAAAFSNISQALCAHELRLLRIRWVDDLYSVWVKRTPFTEEQKLIVHDQIFESYRPFGMKKEKEEIFVGLQMFVQNPTDALNFCMATRTRAEIESGAAKLPHSISNMSLSQRKGLIKGWIMRAVDCASSVQMLNQSLKCVFRELCSLRYPRKLFRQVLHDLSRRYVVLSDATRLSSTWEIEIGSEDWHLFQCTIVRNLSHCWK